MKWPTLAIAALALAAFLTPAWRSGEGAAVAAVPTPAALQYDEITRVVIPPASPPSPGAFQTEYQAVASATPAPQRNGLLAIAQRAMDAYQGVSKGHLTRYTYYKGWVRSEDPIAATATIEKCDRHQYIRLNLAKKTYALSSAVPCPTASAMPQSDSGRPQTSSAAPGTVDMTIKGTSANLGPLTIDGIATNGANHDLELSLTNATGSCRNGDVKMSATQYVSSIGVPRRYCPLPRTASMSPIDMATGTRGGCKPTMHTQLHGLGLGFGDDGNRIVMYSRISFNGGSFGGSNAPQPAGGIAMVTERGNVKWFGGAAADALFAIPAGFTQE
ncbi:MAG: hypothetical protein ABI231_00960 [Candidatus Tumulicola sp.]